MHTIWFWLVLGFLPYAIKRHRGKDEQMLCVQALFWQLTVWGPRGQRSWEIYIPLITRLRKD